MNKAQKLLILIIFLLFKVTTVYASNVCEAYMIDAAKKYNVPMGILYAVGMTETGHKNSLQPFALDIDGKTYFLSSKQEVLAKIKRAKRLGAKYIDIGCMQINERYHGSSFNSIEDMIDVKHNVYYAAKLLSSLHNLTQNWTTAVARYHCSSRHKQEQRRYVCHVIKNLISTGFGGLTKEAKNYCNSRY